MLSTRSAAFAVVALVVLAMVSGCVAERGETSATSHGWSVDVLWDQGALFGANGSDAHMVAVGCVSDAKCFAVGSTTGKATSPIVDEYTHGHWNAARIPGLPARGLANTISCRSGFCLVTGTTVTADGNSSGFARLYRGGSWESIPVPQLPAGYSSDQSVADCTAELTCVIDFWLKDSAGRESDLLLTYRAGTWSAASASVTAGHAKTSIAVQSIRCAEQNVCLTIGTQLGEYANGSWSRPSNMLGSAIPVDASCNMTSCAVEVGPDGIQTNRIVYLDAAAKPREISGVPSVLIDSLGQFACLEEGTCFATQISRNDHGDTIWNDQRGTWRSSVASPTNEFANVTSQLRCDLPSTCAIGGANGTSFEAPTVKPFISVLTPTQRLTIMIPSPSAGDQHGGTITDATCPSIGRCVAIGTIGANLIP